jgi:hypothetical protein
MRNATFGVDEDSHVRWIQEIGHALFETNVPVLEQPR